MTIHMAMNRYLTRLFGSVPMILLSSFLLITVNFNAIASSNEATAKIKSAKSKSGLISLRIDLLIDKKKYNLNDSIALRVLLTNMSNVDGFYLFNDLSFGESSSLTLNVNDATSGKEVPPTFLFDALPPSPRSKENFVYLNPAYIYGISNKISLKQLGITKNGIYKLTAKYRSPVSSKMGFKFPVWTSEMGTIESDPVLIDVADKGER